VAAWSTGMILDSGSSGTGFDSRCGPILLPVAIFTTRDRCADEFRSARYQSGSICSKNHRDTIIVVKVLETFVSASVLHYDQVHAGYSEVIHNHALGVLKCSS
jgi:hypothetical protein